jgi:5,5'-dehydrodivanillate O-demethylase
MLTAEQNERFTRVGPGTPMGELMRRYWHPIAAVSQMNGKHTKKIKLLGEDLILYKDRSGTFGLIEPHCAHRRMNLIYGIPEEHGLRCPYHGWLYDETGQCIEQPYEETEDPDARFKDKIQMKAYPVEQQAGLLMAYMGPEPRPLVPAWDLMVMNEVVRDIGYAELSCNYLQVMENSLDPIHVEWLHNYWANYVMDQLGRSDLVREPAIHQKIHFDRSEFGIIKRRVIAGGSEEDDDWKVGHPIVFPNMLRQGTFSRRSGGGFQIRVPLDDETTAHWWFRCYEMEKGDQPQEPEDIPFYLVPVPQLDEEGRAEWDKLDNNSGQDIVAWITQGAIADREKENLGRSDRGVILYRQMLDEAMNLVADGGDPINTFRDPAKNEYHHLPTETDARFVRKGPNRQRGGAATKYSPIMINREGAVKY